MRPSRRARRVSQNAQRLAQLPGQVEERPRRELQGNARRNIEALQQTFKILINSFYGYLGFSMGHFNDFDQAERVTRRGRELIQSRDRRTGKRGAQVIEVDTDGIYFVAAGYPD